LVHSHHQLFKRVKQMNEKTLNSARLKAVIEMGEIAQNRDGGIRGVVVDNDDLAKQWQRRNRLLLALDARENGRKYCPSCLALDNNTHGYHCPLKPTGK
jgi:hypothetical protein